MATRPAHDECIQLPSSLSWLAPIEVQSLVRVGGDRDGGYVLPEALLRDTDVLISMGLGTNWQFEKDCRTLNPRMRIHVYDHTVSEKLFARQYLLEIAATIAGQGGLEKVKRRRQRLRDYRFFFSREATHFEQRIHDRLDGQSVDISTVFERAGLGHVFVKMDIEGSEYRVLQDIVLYSEQIIGLVIEFHDTGPLRCVFEHSMQLLRQHFEIVHLHANNFGPVYRDGLPEVLEVTFARRDLAVGTRRRSELPLPEFDHPNDPNNPEYQLRFT